MGKGETETVRGLLDAGADPNTPGLRTVYHHGKYQHRPSGTLLHIAARGGHEGTATVLLEGGAEINSTDADGSTPLMVAAHNGHTVATRQLLEAGAQPNLADKNGETALHHACSAGDEVVAALAEGGADLNRTDNDGLTPLMKAAEACETAVVRRLLALGADHAVVATGEAYEDLTAVDLADGGGGEDEDEQAELVGVLREWEAKHADEEYVRAFVAKENSKEERRNRVRPRANHLFDG